MKKKNRTVRKTDNIVFMEDGKAVEPNPIREAFKTPVVRRLTAVALLMLIVVMIAAVAGATGWLSAERIALKFTDMGKGKTAEDNLPIEINGLKVSEIDSVGFCVGVMDERKYYIYSPEFNLLYSFPHNMSDPVTVSSDKRVLMYERGNHRINVFSRKGSVFSQNMEYEVITADMNDRNEIAVATVGDRYLSEVTLLDASGAERLVWHSADRYVTDVAISSNGKQFAVSLIGVENGDEMAAVCIFNVGDSEPIAEFPFDGETVFDIRRMSDGFMAVGTSSAAFFNKNGEMTGKYLYDGDALSAYTVAGEKAVLFFSSHTGGDTSFCVVNSNGERTDFASVGDADHVCGAENGRFYVTGNGGVTEFLPNTGGTYSSRSMSVSGEVIKALPQKDCLLVLTIDGIDILPYNSESEKES